MIGETGKELKPIYLVITNRSNAIVHREIEMVSRWKPEVNLKPEREVILVGAPL